jgi:formylglycine-generating enzyme required for sulfatase activity
LRGGSWANFTNDMRGSFRGSLTPVTTYFNFGFRAARSP